ncbi:hypothetical protein [Azospirillum largimobile]
MRPAWGRARPFVAHIVSFETMRQWKLGGIPSPPWGEG